MNTPTTGEQLDALVQSTEYIRTAVARAKEADESAKTAERLRLEKIELIGKIGDLRIEKAYADEHLVNLAKFMGLHGMTWAHVVSETVSLIEKQKLENDRLVSQAEAAEVHIKCQHVAQWDRLRDALPEQDPRDTRSLVDRVLGVIWETDRLQENLKRALDEKAEMEQLNRVAIAHTEELAKKLRILRAENETLARNVPPEDGVKSNVGYEYEEMREEIADLRDLLRSAHAIAGRRGEDTNWDAFILQLRNRGIGSVTAKTFRLLKDYTFVHLGQDGGRATAVTSLGEPVVMTYNPESMRATKHIGQAWCRADKQRSTCPQLCHPDGTITALCNVYQDIETGRLTYTPIPFDELPRVTEAAAP